MLSPYGLYGPTGCKGAHTVTPHPHSSDLETCLFLYKVAPDSNITYASKVLNVPFQASNNPIISDKLKSRRM